MPKATFSIARRDDELRALVRDSDHRTLARWAIECAERVMPSFEDASPSDHRPRRALETLAEWIDTGIFSMPVIRTASLDAHAAARDAADGSPAQSAARAAGQAVATAHVPSHAYGAAIYSQQAIFRATHSLEDTEHERNWQYRRLRALNTACRSS